MNIDTIINTTALWVSANELLARGIIFAVMIVAALLSHVIAKKLILGTIKKIVRRTPSKWDDILLETTFFHKLVIFVPLLVVYLFIPILILDYPLEDFIRRVLLSAMIGQGVRLANTFLQAAQRIYEKQPISHSHPIKGYAQVLQILLIITGLILAVSTFLGFSPLGILSGLGAMSAVIILIFKDSILGLISSIQLSANRQVKIGDWIEVPQFGADGDVIDISLQSVMVQNWDKTIVTLPTYALTTSGFKNWRGMSESGGRRIKRSVNIDMSSIRFLNNADIERMQSMPLLAGYIEKRLATLAEYNSENPLVPRRMTNIGTFRAYISAYLEAHPQIHNSMTFLIRQLAPTAEGLPIEVYVFSQEQEWARYEAVQADIFDHLLSVLPAFSLRAFQRIGNNALENMATNSI